MTKLDFYYILIFLDLCIVMDSGVTPSGLGRVQVLFVGFRVFFGFQKMNKMYLKFVLSSNIFLKKILHKN